MILSFQSLAPPLSFGADALCPLPKASRERSFGATGTASPRYRLFRYFRACGPPCNGERPSSQRYPSVHNPVQAAISLREALPWDRSVSTALLTSGRRSEFLQQSDPARLGPRVLPCTADSSSGSPSHECVATRSSDLYSHTAEDPSYFPFGGPGCDLSLVRSYRPGCRLISSTALAPRGPGIAVCPQRFLPWAAAPSFCDSPILPVLGHVYCLAPPIPLLVLRATSVWPQGAPIYIATLCRRSVFFTVWRAGPRSQSRKVLSAGALIDILHGSGPKGPRDCSVSTALLTSGRCSEFLRQSDPARPGPRVLPRTANSSSGSPSHECVAARGSDLYSHALPKIRLFSSGGPCRDPSLVRSYRPGRRLISSTALAPRDRASHISSCCMCFGA
ncbi:hypothetical protein NDU88_002921 [Pleurodeles waltl]|uniref:Uncharacterized protein n=1 Tax=Pleurodeles waltl TaxID=8319 RepID=A0AAV7KTG9_PLEWA|nr:hypothetical protein NDU88_002921 [Pleurodeles waltl]